MKLTFQVPTTLGALALAICVGCGGGGGGTSATATVTAPAITTQPANQTVNSQTTATFTIAASGNPSPTFAWQRSDDGGVTWTAISGATSATYSFTTQYASDNQAEFRAWATNSVGTVDSEVASLKVTPMIYVGGQSGTTAGYWLNGTWVALTGPAGSASAFVNCLAVSGSDVYAGGGSVSNANTGIPGYWLNGAWVGLPSASAGVSNWPSVEAIILSGAHVYAGGTAGNGSTAIAGYWLDGTWVELAAGGYVNSMVLSGTDLYAGGDNAANVPGYWLNGAWVALGSTGGAIDSVAVAGAQVYAAGRSTTPGYWLNGTWVGLTLPGTVTATGGNAYPIVVAGTDVYAGYNTFGTTYAAVGYWLNGAWVPLTLPLGATAGCSNALVVVGGNVYAGGECAIGATTVPGYWLNGIWVALPPANGASQSTVYSIIVQ